MLLKFFVTVGATHRDNGVLEWLDAHAGCNPDRKFTLGDNPGFTLHTENSLTDEKDLRWDRQNYVPKEETLKLSSEANRDYRQPMEGTALGHCKACKTLVLASHDYCDVCQRLKKENVRDDAERED